MTQQQLEALTALCYGYGLCNLCSRAVLANIGGQIGQQHSLVWKMHAATSAVLQQIVFIKGALGHEVSRFSTFFVQAEDSHTFTNVLDIVRYCGLRNSQCSICSAKMTLSPSVYMAVRLMEYHSFFS
eukprot:382889-Rhodomonas_salina.1